MNDLSASPHPALQEPLETAEALWQGFPWTASLGLEERGELATYSPSSTDSSSAKAQRRLERWLAQAPFDDPEWRRLRFEKIGDPSRWLELLSTPAAHGPRPEWVDQLAELYALSATDRPNPLRLRGFSVLLGPLISFAAERFQGVFQEFSPADSNSDGLNRNSILGSMCLILARRLNRLVSPALILELRIAGLEERLTGDTAEQRFEDFIRSLEAPDTAEQIFRQYPVLGRQVMACVDRSVDHLRELLKRVMADHSALEEFFGVLGPLESLADSGGDPHRGGRRVYFLRFASGRKLVYKPRPMAVEAAFQDFLEWANSRLPDVPRPVQILDRGDYGFMEWLEPRTCETQAQIETFYRRHGTLLAILHLFGATDLHLENVLAVGDSPVALDLETLFHPHFPMAGTEVGKATVGGLDDTVLRVGLLPNRLIHRGEEQIGLDPSGLGAEVGEKTPKGGVQVQGRGTDQMHLVSAPGEIRSTPGRPTLKGEPVDPIAFAEHVKAGFSAARQALKEHRNELTHFDGPLEVFRGLITRVVLRPTHTYAQLLSGASHPHFLGDAVDRDRHFDHLWLGVRVVPWIEKVVDAECQDLRRGDIPYFSTRTDSRRLMDADGNDCGELLNESGFDGLIRRLKALDSDQTERQKTIIHRSFELRAAERKQRPRPRSRLKERGPNAKPACKDSFLHMAFRAADRLWQRAFMDSTGARWLVPRRLGVDRWALAEAGPDLYDGLSGICLFLTSLAQIGGRAQDAELAAAAEASLRYQLTFSTESLKDDRLRQVGAYSGWGGVIHTLCRLASLRQDDSWLDLAVGQLPRMGELLPEDKSFDVVGGSAGAALALCELALRRSQSEASQLARQCGEHLLEHALAQEKGLGWPPPDAGHDHGPSNDPSSGNPLVPLGGLSHGTSGIAWAFFELTRLAGLPQDCKKRFEAAAFDALEYEETLFDAEQGNWCDARPRPDGEKGFLAAWCHGAPGIGIARLAIADTLKLESNRALDFQKILHRDLERAIPCTLDQGFGLTHSLCHGDLGNLDFLLEASRLTVPGLSVQGSLPIRVSRLAASILDSVDRQGFLFGTPGGTEPPGLMLGIAGIGFGFLRLAAPDQVPSILRLAQTPGKDGSLLRSMSAGLNLNRSGGNA